VISVEALPAEHGDCLWVEWDDGPYRRRMLIDGGPGTRNSLPPGLKARFDRQPADPAAREFELVVCTHIDDDHITGLLPLLSAPPEHFSTRDIWFNGHRHMGGRDTLGARGANLLVDRLTDSGLPWNRAAEGGPIVVPDDGPLPVFTPRGLRLTLLSPTRARLDKLLKHWPDPRDTTADGDQDLLGPTADDDGTGHTGLTPERLAEIITDRPYRPDRNPANGSSIAFLAEHPDGSRVLFGADAHAETLVESLGRRWHGGGFPVALCKVPHHGSAHNVSSALLGALDCRHWLFSTNGGRGHETRLRSGRSTHPDLAAVARILLHDRQRGPGATLWFNHRSPSTERYRDPSLHRCGLRAAEYPQEGTEGITVLVRGTTVVRGQLPPL
jgi:hypothetical protein